MATIEHPGLDHDERVALFRGMDRGTLIAQQMVQRGAIDALEYLVEAGFTRDIADQMLTSLREGLSDLHEVANSRGIQLVSYQAT